MKCLKHHAQRLATGLLLGMCAVHFAHAATDCNQVTEIPVSECQSLLELYNSTNGANWTNKTGWNETNTPCSWFGVTCGTGHVQRLDLPYNQLSGSIPNFTNLPNLTHLILYKNQLNGSVPNFTHLPNLTMLHLGSNQLSGSIPNFTNLPNLTTLSLYENQLSGSIPDFTNLPNLTGLGLSSNRLSGSVLNFTNLPNLQFLEISFNQLSGSIPNFTNLPNLIYLRLASNQLSGSIPNFTNLPNLRNLYLFSNQLSGSIPNFSSFNLANVSLGAKFSGNCELTAYDAAQETILNRLDPIWKTQNPNCTVVSQCATFISPVVNVPCVNVSGTVYQAKMNLIAILPAMRFEVDTSSLQLSSLIPNEQCAVFPAPNTLDHLRINCLDLGDKYWVDLKLVNANPIQFDLVNYAKN